MQARWGGHGDRPKIAPLLLRARGEFTLRLIDAYYLQGERWEASSGRRDQRVGFGAGILIVPDRTLTQGFGAGG